MAGYEIKPWMARLHVKPIPHRRSEIEGAGAYALVLALASSEIEYHEMVAAEMKRIGLFIVEMENLEPYAQHEDDEATIVECAERLSHEWPVQYHTFHCYPRDDA
jgi:hypothetical protein